MIYPTVCIISILSAVTNAHASAEATTNARPEVPKTTPGDATDYEPTNDVTPPPCDVIEREANACPQFFPCVRGECREIVRDSNVLSLRPSREMYCHCDPGWSGQSCSQCCNIQCQNNGSCLIDPLDGTPFCGCRWGFHGALCEKRRRVSSPTPTQTTDPGRWCYLLQPNINKYRTSLSRQ